MKRIQNHKARPTNTFYTKRMTNKVQMLLAPWTPRQVSRVPKTSCNTYDIYHANSSIVSTNIATLYQLEKGTGRIFSKKMYKPLDRDCCARLMKLVDLEVLIMFATWMQLHTQKKPHRVKN